MNTPDSGRQRACASCPLREKPSVNWRGKGLGASIAQALRRNKGRFPCHTDHSDVNAVLKCGPTGANDCVGFQHMLRGKKGFIKKLAELDILQVVHNTGSQNPGLDK